MPAQWTSANLSFQISDDGVTYYDLVDKMGAEALIPVVAGTATMIRMEPWSSAIGWWKLRSGSVRGASRAASRTHVQGDPGTELIPKRERS
jgi:hypothetical protein